MYKKRLLEYFLSILKISLCYKHKANLYPISLFLILVLLYNCASKIAGFNFPLTLSNYTVRAMKGMFEVTYPLDEFRYVTVRKSMDEKNGFDNSGDYTQYEHNDIITLKNGVKINIRGNGDKINIMYFAAESGVFSARCEEGMTSEEVEGIYKIIAEAEAPKYIP